MPRRKSRAMMRPVEKTNSAANPGATKHKRRRKKPQPKWKINHSEGRAFQSLSVPLDINRAFGGDHGPDGAYLGCFDFRLGPARCRPDPNGD
jgi:hypothetical protein